METSRNGPVCRLIASSQGYRREESRHFHARYTAVKIGGMRRDWALVLLCRYFRRGKIPVVTSLQVSIAIAAGLLFSWQTPLAGATHLVVKEEQVSLRSECSDHAPEVASLRKGQVLRLRFSIAGGESPCYSVSVEMDGSTVRGYVSKSFVAGAEDFEQTRRKASFDGQVLVSVISTRLPREDRPPEGATTEPDRPPQGSLLGQLAGDFALTDLSRRSFRLAGLRGKVVMLNFWATWCGVCRRGMPQLEALNRELAPRGLVLLGVNGESERNARNFVKGNGYTFPTLVDSGNKVAGQFQVTAIPTAVVIDRRGRIVSYLVGLHSEKTLREALARAGLPL